MCKDVPKATYSIFRLPSKREVFFFFTNSPIARKNYLRGELNTQTQLNVWMYYIARVRLVIKFVNVEHIV